jgi:hypothetical protein
MHRNLGPSSGHFFGSLYAIPEFQRAVLGSLRQPLGSVKRSSLLAIAQSAQMTGTRALAVNKWNFEGCDDWVLDPYAYDQAIKAVSTILEAFRPKGNVSAKPVGDFARMPIASLESLGQGLPRTFYNNSRNRMSKGPRQKSPALHGNG